MGPVMAALCEDTDAPGFDMNMSPIAVPFDFIAPLIFCRKL